MTSESSWPFSASLTLQSMPQNSLLAPKLWIVRCGPTARRTKPPIACPGIIKGSPATCGESRLLSPRLRVAQGIVICLPGRPDSAVRNRKSHRRITNATAKRRHRLNSTDQRPCSIGLDRAGRNTGSSMYSDHELNVVDRVRSKRWRVWWILQGTSRPPRQPE